MSEGINFSDDLGRLGLFLLACVIPIDLPNVARLSNAAKSAVGKYDFAIAAQNKLVRNPSPIL